MSFLNSALDIIQWLETAVDTVDGVKLIRERYNIANSAWINRYRSDCGMEAALAFLVAWKHTKEEKYLSLSRDLYAGVVSLQNADGSFPYYKGETRAYANDNAEVAIFLFRMAEIDTENAETYRNKALEITDYFISNQNANGTWARSTADASQSALFTAHPVSALATAYKFTDNKAAYQASIERALSWISGKICDDGHITLAGTNEAQRPPSSDQAIVIRAYAMAEMYIPHSAKASSWRAQRQKMLDWFLQLLAENGAVKNGLGEGLNGADTPNITDHVYTTPFAIEALYFCFCVDGKVDYWQDALKLVKFVESNIYYSDDANANGVLRGGYNLKDNNWDTSEALLDASQQGGGDMVYTGWTNAPLAVALMVGVRFAEAEIFYSAYADSKIFRFKSQTDGAFKVYAGEAVGFRLVEEESIFASNVKICTDGKPMSFAYL